jgi:hypothetical protein
MQETSGVNWLSSRIEEILEAGDINLLKSSLPSLVENSKEIEKKRLIEAIIYSLDEDGHTGDWKIKFANDYYYGKFQKNI